MNAFGFATVQRRAGNQTCAGLLLKTPRNGGFFHFSIAIVFWYFRFIRRFLLLYCYLYYQFGPVPHF